MLPVYKETYLSETLSILVADIRIERLLHHMRVTWYSNPPYLRCLAGWLRKIRTFIDRLTAGGSAIEL